MQSEEGQAQGGRGTPRGSCRHLPGAHSTQRQPRPRGQASGGNQETHPRPRRAPGPGEARLSAGLPQRLVTAEGRALGAPGEEDLRQGEEPEQRP